MRKTPGLLVAALVLAALATAGCTAVSTLRTPSPSPTFASVIFSGTQSGEKVFSAPSAARSATITVVCAGDSFFTLTGALDDQYGGLTGQCNWGGYQYQLAIPAGQRLDLVFELQSPGSFVVETRFSADRYSADAEIKRECSTMVTVGSDVANSEDGYSQGKVTAADWHTRIAAAVTALAKLRTDKPNILSAALANIRRDLTAPGIAPGAFDGTAGVSYQEPLRIVGQACAANGTPIYELGEFGG
jgi:hypothetical protein